MKIKKLKIYTSNFNKQIIFYTKTLGLSLIDQTEFEATVKIGESILVLEKNAHFQPYHFAINIPSNQETEALNWLKQRVDILKDGTHEIQDFDFWNAKAIYFYDEDKNIVEFIARKNLSNARNTIFNPQSLLNISEIGVPVNDIATTYKTLQKTIELPIYDGGFERFCAIGNENGLFICINKNIKDWFPTGDNAASSEFEISFTKNNIAYQLKFKNSILENLD